MEYIKYRLKKDEELQELINNLDDVFVVSCNKCFKEFDPANADENDALVSKLKEAGKTVLGSASLDFLCNEYKSIKALESLIPEGVKNVLVASCGLGVQTLAENLKLPCYAAADSKNYIGHHGMALTNKTCGACNQCYLNATGGICPIVDCTKSLLNGQCGGAKNGMCEIDPQKPCAWERINNKLKEQGLLEEFLEANVQIRDYSKVNHKEIKAFVDSIREKRYDGYYGGVHPQERKYITEHMSPVLFPEPDVVVIPVSMHAGAPAAPIVAVGDHVDMGQKIAEKQGFISANIHASVSGEVVAIENRPCAGKGEVLSIVIKSDHKDTLSPQVKPNKDYTELSPEEIVSIVDEKGIVGMGGAGFPAYVKLKPGKHIDYVLINGSECEPLITADHRALLKYAGEIIYGTRAIMKAVDAKKGIIVIEDNKADAIEHVKEVLNGAEDIEVLAARTKYPQGAEKMLIYKVTGRRVPSGGLPADVGCVVSNTSTAKAIRDAIVLGMPLIERITTVSGEYMAKPANFILKVGTSVADVIAYCGGITNLDYVCKLGGPMMGTVIENLDVPVMKGTNGIIAIPKDHTVEVGCIQCGRCVDVCPMELSPVRLTQALTRGDVAYMKENRIMDCMECGCCEYICSSKIPLVKKLREGKKQVKEMK